MEHQHKRIFLFISILFVGLFLHSAWQAEHQQAPSQPPIIHDGEIASNAINSQTEALPSVASSSVDKQEAIPQLNPSEIIPAERLVTVSTDVYIAKIDRLGGDLVSLKLNQYPEKIDTPEQGVTLFDFTPEHYFVAQSGLMAENGPDSKSKGRSEYQSASPFYALNENQEKLTVDLSFQNAEGVRFLKRYHFHKNSYVIDVEYLVANDSAKPFNGRFYGRLKRGDHVAETSGAFGSFKGYTGAALHTKEKTFKKVEFKDIKKKTITETIEDGWCAMIEHYFLGAWIPQPSDVEHHYMTERLGGERYSVGFVAPELTVQPGAKGRISAKLYAGPETTDTLKNISSGLELTVDYGILWPICQPIFWLLKTIYSFIGNWGWAIVCTTLVIKLMLYQLSATSYRSMGNMRKLQPKIEALKERYGEDKQKFGQAMMELYKREKVNPLGGCLPMIIQMPIFIALYFVLISSVELRQAPFALWIMDLSSKDPYYVLPVLNGLTMFVQQRLNPAPPDPVQAKVMSFMPIMFTVLFLQFPAGLMLYWVANNLLSIAQQWMITRSIERGNGKK